MSEVKSDSSTTSKIFSTIKKAVDDCKSVSEPEKDDSTTVTGNTNAHSAIDNLIKLNKDVANAIEQASENIKKWVIHSKKQMKLLAVILVELKE